MSLPPAPCTLIIPTHDRPVLLSRLLDYLERERADVPVLVLDSSADGPRRENARRAGHASLSIRHQAYPPDMDPFLKIRDGADLVATPYCSICADDDVVLLPAIRECLRLLDGHGDLAAAHGAYFNFAETETFDLTYIVSRGLTAWGPEPVERVREMFAAYEAVFYAVYRTPVLRSAFRRVGEVRTVLGRELLAGALTAASGKIARLDDFYYGRRTGQSLSYENWHPHQILANSPALLFRDYRILRDIVLDHLRGLGTEASRMDHVGATLDLVFLGYLGPFLRADILDLIIRDRLAERDPRHTVEHLWDVFVRCGNRAKHPLEPLIRRRGAFIPDRFRERGRRKDYVHPSRTIGGAPRTYKIFHEFVFPQLKPPAAVDKERLLRLLARLDAY